ncbi:MAG: ImmA/IrrE family metallo-endopeptidase [Bacilli bacterium]
MKFNKDNIIHPNIYLIDMLKTLNIDLDSFVNEIKVEKKEIDDFINGGSITTNLAIKFAEFFNVSEKLWFNLQKNYDEMYEQEFLDIEKKYLKYFSNNILNLLNITNKDLKTTINSLHHLFRISSFEELSKKDLYSFCSVGKAKKITEKETVLQNAWIKWACSKANYKTTKEYSKKKLINNLSLLRTYIIDNNHFPYDIEKVFAECGIVFVCLPYFEGSNVSGAIKWSKDRKKVMLAINDYGKLADRIWFNIFHEIGHIINGDQKQEQVFDEYPKQSIEEIKANEFARDVLVPNDSFQKFLEKFIFQKQEIITFAKTINSVPYIIIGRLEKDGFLKYNSFPELRRKYFFS